MTVLEIVGYCVLVLSGAASACYLSIGRGRAISLVFLYLLAYQGMEMFLKWEKVNYFNDISYISLALAIDMFWFYLFFPRALYFLSIVIGFDVMYAGANLFLLRSGVETLDVVYGHVGIAVSILLLIGGVCRGINIGPASADDSWDLNLPRRVRALFDGKGAKS